MKILGITGGIGSGKSTVTRLFADLGAETADADVIAKQVTEPYGAAYKQIIMRFGNEILNPDKTINRKILAETVFANKDKLEILNNITHRCVTEKLKDIVSKSHAKLVCLDVPLLFTCKYPIYCDKTLAVIADTDVRIDRVMKRSGLSEKEIISRMKNQLSNEEFKTKADFCIVNNGSLDDIIPKVREIYDIMTECGYERD